MYHTLERPQERLPASNYGSAVARALEWLGDRYLLAKPINAGIQTRAQPRRLDTRQELASIDR